MNSNFAQALDILRGAEEWELIEEFLRTAPTEGGIPRHIFIQSNSTVENLLLRGATESNISPIHAALKSNFSFDASL